MTKIIDTSKLLPPFEELFDPNTLKKVILRSEALNLIKELGDGENLYIFIGSSGAGRDTVLEETMKKLINCERIKRTTTRNPRELIKDVDLQRLIFISEKKFLINFKSGKILFAGRYLANRKLYGISKNEVLKINKKQHCLLEENFSGLPLKLLLPKSKLIVVLPPTIDVLKDRLFTRDTQDDESIERFKISLCEIRFVVKNLKTLIKEKFVDMVIINEGFPAEIGEKVARKIIAKEKLFDDYSRLERSLVGSNKFF